MSKTALDFEKERKRGEKDVKKRKQAATSPATFDRPSAVTTADGKIHTALQACSSDQYMEDDDSSIVGLPTFATVLEQIRGLGRRK
jgi:hypothetical protein